MFINCKFSDTRWLAISGNERNDRMARNRTAYANAVPTIEREDKRFESKAQNTRFGSKSIRSIYD